MMLRRKPDQTITTRVTFEVHSARPLPLNRVRSWMRALTWPAVSLHDEGVFQPGSLRADESGWEYAHIDFDQITVEQVEP